MGHSAERRGTGDNGLNIKTYSGRTMAEALARVKQDLGAHAVVLHTRSYKQGGVLGIGAKPVVEVSAADGRAIGRSRSQQRARQQARPAAKAKAASVAVAPAVDQAATGDLIRRTYAAARAELQQAEASAKPVASATRSPAVPSAEKAYTVSTAPVQVAGDRLADEMAEVKRMLARVAMQQKKTSAPAAGADLPDALFDQYRRLIEQELAEELAEEVIERARQAKGDTQAQAAVAEAIQAMLPVDRQPGQLPEGQNGRPPIVALVGPTGVGKTTTIAKLAATYKIKHGKHVGLITMDTYRIAAVDQLKTYAQIIGLPLHVVNNPDELDRAIRLCAGCDAILIDTAGRSQRHGDRLSELAQMLEAIQPQQTHLVMSASSSTKVMHQIVERFASVKPDRVIFTKLDEAVSYGPLLAVARSAGLAISFVTTGQEVPHQIEPACAHRLAQLVMTGCLEGETPGPGASGRDGAWASEPVAEQDVVQPTAVQPTNEPVPEAAQESVRMT